MVNGSAVRALTDGRMDRWTNATKYIYLPASQSMKILLLLSSYSDNIGILDAILSIIIWKQYHKWQLPCIYQ